MYGVAVADAENIGANQVYAACGDGHIYEYKYASGSWTRYDLGNTPTAFYALAIGNANNDAGNTLKVYALGQNNHVFEFTAASVPAVTSTPTPGLTVTPTIAIPQNYFKVFHSQINPLHGEQARIRWTQPQAGPVSITIYNLLGDKVAAPLAGVSFAAGEYHEVDWNGRTQKGAVAGSGIYIVVVDTPGNETRGKVAVIK
jgi:hypothetical protein